MVTTCKVKKPMRVTLSGRHSTGKMEEITHLSNALRSLIMMVIEPLVVMVVTKEDLSFETFLDLKKPPFNLVKHVGTMLKNMA